MHLRPWPTIVLALASGCVIEPAMPDEDSILLAEDTSPSETDGGGSGEDITAHPGSSESCSVGCRPIADAVAAFSIRNQQDVGCSNWGPRYYNYLAEGYQRIQDFLGPDFGTPLEECKSGFFSSFLMAGGANGPADGEIPNTAIRFLSNAEGDEPTRITLSGQFAASACDLEIRPMIDGDLVDEPMLLSMAAGQQTTAFSWLVPVTEGMHALSFHWSVTECAAGQGPSVRNVTVHAESTSRTAWKDVFAATAVSDAPWSITLAPGGDSGWQDLPLAISPFSIDLEQSGPLAVELSGLLGTDDETIVEARLLVDGLSIGEFVVANENVDESSPFVPITALTRPRTVTFVDDEVAAGKHSIVAQLRVRNYGDAIDGNKKVTLSHAKVSALSRGSALIPFATTAFASNLDLVETEWTTMPGNSTTLLLEHTSEAMATTTWEIEGDFPYEYNGNPFAFDPVAPIEIAPVVNGSLREDLAVTLMVGGSFRRETNQWTFALKDLAPNVPVALEFAYRRGAGEIEDFTLLGGTTVTQSHAYRGPDLGLGPRVGVGSLPKAGRSARRDSRVEPGSRGSTYPLIAVYMDTKRLKCDGPNLSGVPNPPANLSAPWAACVQAGAPLHPTMTAADLYNMLYGDATNVADFLETLNGGRSPMANEGVYLVATPNAPADDSQNDYVIPVCPCGQAGTSGTYTSSRSRIITEAILGARQQGGLDLSDYDTNGDGALTPDELSFLVVTPQHDLVTGSPANALVGAEMPYCGLDANDAPSCTQPPAPLIVDGVTIESTVIWRADISSPRTLGDTYTAAHELLHIFEWLDDSYVRLGANGALANSAPVELDLMASVPSGSAASGLSDGLQRLSGFLALTKGWVTPVFPEQGTATYMLSDVAYGGNVMVLPRLDGATREYFLLEVRQDHIPTVEPDAYDFFINDNGLAIWHVVEPSETCTDNDLTDCEAMQPEFCDMGGWTQYSDDSYARYAARLLQPDLVYNNASTGRGTATNPDKRLWSDAGTQVSGTAGSGTCPGGGLPAANGVTGVPELWWSDGSPAPYALENFVYDAVNGTVTFDLTEG